MRHPDRSSGERGAEDQAPGVAAVCAPPPAPAPAAADATAAIPQVGPERTTQQPLPPKPPLDLLAEPKLSKAMAFVQQPAERQVRTNNHVERMNRRLRFAEKVRYRWR